MIRGLRIQVVVEDAAPRRDPRLLAQHGLCLLLDADLGQERMRVLMDAGASAEVTLQNMDLLGIDPESIDLILLSHGHYDHTGGLLGVLGRLKRRMPVLAHPGIFEPKLRSQPFLRFIGPPFSLCQAESAGAVMLLSRGPTALAPGLTATGEVERISGFEDVKGFWTIRDVCHVQDCIPDDQSIIAEIEGRGLAILTGCAHAGIINIISQARRMTGSDDVYAVAGGLHLIDASRERIVRTAEELKALCPDIVLPGHCTGSEAIGLLKDALGERCRMLFTGDVIEL
ncbi:MAG: MBL fold metallo-hydrolase [Methanothrix sp.]|nr:MBL fold metallo-hydrolase [Methanothrix sp.]